MAELLLRGADDEGYGAVRLETLASMTEARALYLSLGFREIPPYDDNSRPGVRYMERRPE